MSVAAIIPAYRVKNKISCVLNNIQDIVTNIYVIDDRCPEETGRYVLENHKDPRIQVIFNLVNMGVGGATLIGFEQAIKDGSEILIKIDGDGQMDPLQIPRLIKPLIMEQADYTKGNRFYTLSNTNTMPIVRLLGNTGLSFLTKLSSGYWNIFDPTNGYIAIPAKIFELIPYAKIDKRFFFESDFLFHLNIIQAVVVDISMPTRYADEKSNMNPTREIFIFWIKNIRNLTKRIIYNYFIRDFNVASIELVTSIFLMSFGFIFGVYHWIFDVHHPVSPGTVMVAALPIILGMQLFLSFLQYDILMLPRKPLQKYLSILKN